MIFKRYCSPTNSNVFGSSDQTGGLDRAGGLDQAGGLDRTAGGLDRAQVPSTSLHHFTEQ